MKTNNKNNHHLEHLSLLSEQQTQEIIITDASMCKQHFYWCSWFRWNWLTVLCKAVTMQLTIDSSADYLIICENNNEK